MPERAIASDGMRRKNPAVTNEWQKKRKERVAKRKAEQKKAKAESEANAKADQIAKAEQEKLERPINELCHIYFALLAARGEARQKHPGMSEEDFSKKGIGLLRDAMSRLPNDVARRLVDALSDCDEKDVFEAMLGGEDDTELIRLFNEGVPVVKKGVSPFNERVPLFKECVLDLASRLVGKYMGELAPSFLDQQLEPKVLAPLIDDPKQLPPANPKTKAGSLPTKSTIEPPTAPAVVTLEVNVQTRSATLRIGNVGDTADLPSEGVARWLKVLAEHPDKWIRPADYMTHGGDDLDGVKPSDKLKSLKKKCPKLAKLIQASKHDGMRFNPSLAVKSSHSLPTATN